MILQVRTYKCVIMYAGIEYGFQELTENGSRLPTVSRVIILLRSRIRMYNIVYVIVLACRRGDACIVKISKVLA